MRHVSMPPRPFQTQRPLPPLQYSVLGIKESWTQFSPPFTFCVFVPAGDRCCAYDQRSDGPQPTHYNHLPLLRVQWVAWGKDNPVALPLRVLHSLWSLRPFPFCVANEGQTLVIRRNKTAAHTPSPAGPEHAILRQFLTVLLMTSNSGTHSK